MIPNWTDNLKVGDRVWVRDGSLHWTHTVKRSIDTVVKITKTQITTQDVFGEYRFSRSSRLEITSSSYKMWLADVATDEEFAEWDRTEGERERKVAAENAAFDARKKAIVALKAKLPETLQPSLYLLGSKNREGELDLSSLKLELSGLTDEQVEKIAVALTQEAPVAISRREQELLKGLEAALEWIDAVPKSVVLPTMPGFDRDWVNDVVEEARRAN